MITTPLCYCEYRCYAQKETNLTGQYTWLYNDIPDNQCQIFRAPSVFYFSADSLILC